MISIVRSIPLSHCYFHCDIGCNFHCLIIISIVTLLFPLSHYTFHCYIVISIVTLLFPLSHYNFHCHIVISNLHCRLQRKLSLSTLQSKALQQRDGKKTKKKLPPKKTKPKQAKVNGCPNERLKDMLIASDSIEMAAIEGGMEVSELMVKCMGLVQGHGGDELMVKCMWFTCGPVEGHGGE